MEGDVFLLVGRWGEEEEEGTYLLVQGFAMLHHLLLLL
jgi:hypothetical protein